MSLCIQLTEDIRCENVDYDILIIQGNRNVPGTRLQEREGKGGTMDLLVSVSKMGCLLITKLDGDSRLLTGTIHSNLRLLSIVGWG